MGDSALTEQQNESLSVARILDFSNPDSVGADGTIKDETLLNTQDEHGPSLGNGLNNGGGTDHVSSSIIRDEISHTEVDIKEVDSHSMQGSSRTGIEVNNKVVAAKAADEFEELLQLAQEYESEEAAKRKLDDKPGKSPDDSVEEEPSKQNGVLHFEEQQRPAVKENHLRAGQKPDMKIPNFESAESKKSGYFRPQVPKGQLSSSSYLALSKSASKDAARVDTEGVLKRKKTVGEDAQVEGAESRNLRNSVSQGSITVGPSRSNFTVPQPFALATDKRASLGGRLADDDAAGQAHKSHRRSGVFGSSSFKNSQVSKKLGSKLHVVKSVHSESMKHREETLMKPIIPVEPKHDEEDAQSVSSVQSGSKAPKAKASVFTSTTGFNFRCNERAEKRKEFYSRLEEKLSAKEEEKNQMQAKTKEEVEAEVRMLRKSLTFKASPMPSFYQEGAPPKVELKKIPTTRAKSPKFGRRNSCVGFGGASNRSCQSNRCEQELSSSDSLQKLAGGNTDKVLGKGYNGNSKKPVRRSLSKLPIEKPFKSKSPDSPRPDVASLDMDTASANGSIDSVKVRVRQPSGNCSVCASDEEKGDDHADGLVVSKHETSAPAEREVDCVNTTEGIDPKGASGSTEMPDERGKVKNGTDLRKGQGNKDKGMPSSASNKLKPGRNFHPFASDDSQDATVKVSKTTRRESLKPSLPSFRKRESVGNAVKPSLKTDHDTTPVIVDVAVHS